jgi:hypothetical protein
MFCESREKGGKWPCHAEDRLRVFGRGERRETSPRSRRRELLAPFSAGATATRRSRPKGTTKGTQARSQGARRNENTKHRSTMLCWLCFLGCSFRKPQSVFSVASLVAVSWLLRFVPVRPRASDALDGRPYSLGKTRAAECHLCDGLRHGGERWCALQVWSLEVSEQFKHGAPNFRSVDWLASYIKGGCSFERHARSRDEHCPP